MITEKILKEELYKGSTVSEISKKYNCSENTIYRKKREYGICAENSLYKNKEWLQKELIAKDIQDIALEQGVETHTISRWMKTFNIKKEKPIYQNKEWLEEQSYIYRNAKELAEAHNLVENTVKSWCRKYNVKFNNSKDSSFDEDYFEKIDNEYKAYFLGFLMADGFMQKTLKTFGIGLCISDQYIIEAFLNELKYKTNLIEKESGFGKPSIYAYISSAKMCKDLIYLGIVPKKSGKEVFPTDEIPEVLRKHFIRGFLDGDGWITNYTSTDKKYNKLAVGMCSMSLNILYDIAEYLESVLKIKANITKRNSKKNLYDLLINGNNAQIVLDYIYSDSKIYLKRKKEKYYNARLGPVNKNV